MLVKDFPEYRVWAEMRRRCRNSKRKDFVNYGGRGITICARWEDFHAFLSDMGPRPSSTYSLDRINNDGDYEPGNCRWVTRLEQNNNKRTSRILEFGGRSLNLAGWGRTLGIPAHILSWRIRNGWSVSRALSQPLIKRKRVAA